MKYSDAFRLALTTLRENRMRSLLTILGIVIGIASVILLTSIGEGTRTYMLSEFTQFGTNLLTVAPGNVKTTGLPGAVGGSIRKLTLEDFEAVKRLPGIEDAIPVVMGSAAVEWKERSRSIMIFGTTAEAIKVFKFNVRQGSFLPPGDPRQGSNVTVLAPKLKQELFGDANALGEYVRIGGRRFLVIGIREPKGRFLGIDIDDVAYIPVSHAMTLFNSEALKEIDIHFTNSFAVKSLVADLKETLMRRHGGEEDFTIVTQTEMLATLGNVIGIISVAVGAIGAISLLVGGIGIMTMMWIAVHERTTEIGLAKALGATQSMVLTIFLTESVLLSSLGGLLGYATGWTIAMLLRVFVPGLPLSTPVEYVFLALVISFVVGLASGVLPARRAAQLDPVEALAAE